MLQEQNHRQVFVKTSQNIEQWEVELLALTQRDKSKSGGEIMWFKNDSELHCEGTKLLSTDLQCKNTVVLYMGSFIFGNFMWVSHEKPSKSILANNLVCPCRSSVWCMVSVLGSNIVSVRVCVDQCGWITHDCGFMKLPVLPHLETARWKITSWILIVCCGPVGLFMTWLPWKAGRRI